MQEDTLALDAVWDAAEDQSLEVSRPLTGSQAFNSRERLVASREVRNARAHPILAGLP